MPTSGTPGEPVNVRVSSRSSLVDSIQEIMLRTALNRAIGLVTDCFDNFNRAAEPGSVSTQQAEACAKDYPAFGGHATTVTYTNNFARSLVHSGLDHLKGATNAVLDTGSELRWSSLTLTRSLIEASSDCLWLIDPKLDLETRLRRTNQMLVRACDEMLKILPDSQDATPRLVLVDPIARVTSLEVRDAALKWASAQNWKCDSGKTITRRRWIGEIPSRKEAVALAAEEAPDYWKDVYGMLSGATHSQPLLMTLALSDEPGAFLDRALMVLDIGISFYTQTLRSYAEFMGWSDHDIDNWFGPVHATLQHLRSPENTPLPLYQVKPDRCTVCPDYQDPAMHRLALISHLCARFERSIGRDDRATGHAPGRYVLALESVDELQQAIMGGDDAAPQTREMRTGLGSGHMGVLSLLGVDPSEVITSAAACWAVLRSPDYQSSVGTIQGWLLKSDDRSPAVPYWND